MTPKVSVVIAFFNEEAYIDECIMSVRQQTFSDFELIMVNDGSTDKSAEIAKKHAAQDERIRLIDIEKSGIVPAVTKGISEARGEYLARMDADDIMHEERLRLQCEYLDAHPDISVLGSLVEVFPQKIISPNMQYYINWLNSLTDHESITRDIFVESPIANPSAMLRREELIALGGYEDNGMPEDYGLWLKYYAAGKKFAKVPKALLFWREHGDRVTRTSEVYSLENFLRLRTQYLADTILKDKERIFVWGAGKNGKNLFKLLNAKNLDLAGFIDIDPKKISQNICGQEVIGYNEIKGLNCFIVVCVGAKGARELIRNKLIEFGYKEIYDFICAA